LLAGHAQPPPRRNAHEDPLDRAPRAESESGVRVSCFRLAARHERGPACQTGSGETRAGTHPLHLWRERSRLALSRAENAAGRERSRAQRRSPFRWRLREPRPPDPRSHPMKRLALIIGLLATVRAHAAAPDERCSARADITGLPVVTLGAKVPSDRFAVMITGDGG